MFLGFRFEQQNNVKFCVMSQIYLSCSVNVSTCWFPFAQNFIVLQVCTLHQDQDDLICTNADSKTGEKEAIRNITK